MSLPTNLSGEEKRALLARLLRERSEPAFPLSHGQRGMWLEVQRHPQNAALNIGFAARSHTPIDRRALRQAAQQLGRRHPCLRTTIEIRRGEVVQVVRPTEHLHVEEVEAVGWSDEHLQARVQEEFHRPFDLVRGPLARTVLFHRGEAEDVLLFVLHHLVGDFWSLVLLAEDWPGLYRCARLGIPTPPSDEPVSYADFVDWQHQLLTGPEGTRLKEFWKDELAATDFVLELPFDFPRPLQQTFRGAMHPIRLAPRLTDDLRQLSQRCGVTLYATLMAAYQLLVGQAATQHSFCVGSPLSGRSRPEFARIVGFLSNILPVKADLSGNPTITELVQSVGRISLRAMAHQDFPFPLIVEQHKVLPDASRTPLFQTTFTLEKSQGQHALGAAQFVTGGRVQKVIGDLRLEPFPVRQQTSQTDLSLLLEDTPECLAGFFRYNSDLFSADTIARLASRWEGILRAFVTNPQQRIDTLRLVSVEEERQLEAWGTGPRQPREPLTLSEMVTRQASLTPMATALIEDDRSWTYQEMDRASHQLANHLRQRGVGPGAVVPLYLSRSAEMIVAVLAVLKAGAAFAPLSPSDPAERTWQLLEELQADFIITDHKTDRHLPDFDGDRLCLDAAMWESETSDEDGPHSLTSAVDDLAYVIFTSGSTGRPHGVAVEHRTIGNTVCWRNEQFPLAPDDRVLLTFSYAFDPAVVAIFSTLSSGATLVIPPDQAERDPAQLGTWMRRYHVTVLQMTPSQLRLVLDGVDHEAGTAVRLVICGGEAMPNELPQRIENTWRGAASPVDQTRPWQLVNLYGPTECACDVCFWECRREDGSQNIPIGRPIANVSVQVLDPQGRTVPVGIPGELSVSGVGLARGYWQNPALTAQRFLAANNDQRWFLTGDRVRWRADGALEFLGRLDQQIKLHGHRIEAAEIERVLRTHPQIRDAAVFVAQPEGQAPRLAACLVAASEAPLVTEEDLRKFARLRLPDYMVPSLWAWATEIPTTANGKRDDKALSARVSGPVTPETLEPPQTPLECDLAERFSQVIGIATVGRRQNFFDLGGSSIDAALLVIALQKKLDEYIYTIALYDAPTVADLSHYLAEMYPAAVERCFGRESLVFDKQHEPTVVTEQHLAEMRQLLRVLPSGPTGKKPADRNPPMVFLLSAPRSGSTLTRAMLGGHPRVFAPPELQLLNFRTLSERRAAFDRDRDRFWLDGTVRALMELFHLDADAARERMEQCERDQLTVKEFYRLMQDRLGNRWFLDKTPMYALDAAVLQQATVDFHEPRFIHLVRHPQAMQASFVKARLEVFFQPFLRGPHRFAAAELAELVWTISQQNIRDFLSTIPPERQLSIRFEDLVAQPQAVMEHAAHFLDLDFDPAMLTPQAEQQSRMTDPVHPLARMLGDVRFHEHHGIDASRAYHWQQDDSGLRLGEPTWQLAEEFGYQRTEPTRRPMASRRPSIHDLVVPLQATGSRPPVYWIHPPGGIVVCYHALAKHLGPERPVIAIRARGAHGEADPQSSVEDMAATYGAEILRSSPSGLIHLGGWSAGGVIAIEVARWLKDRGRPCGLIALLDSSVPVDASQYPEGVTGLPPAVEYGLDISLIELARLSPSAQLDYILAHARQVGIVQADTPLHLVQDTLDHLGRLFHAHVQAVQQHQLSPHIGSVALFRPEESVTVNEARRDKGWGDYADVQVEIVPGGHYTMVKEPHVRELARALSSLLMRAEKPVDS